MNNTIENDIFWIFQSKVAIASGLVLHRCYLSCVYRRLLLCCWMVQLCFAACGARVLIVSYSFYPICHCSSLCFCLYMFVGSVCLLIDWLIDSTQVRWANVQAIGVKFSQDLTHQKSLKSINFSESYLKNKKVDVFGTQCICCFTTSPFSKLLACELWSHTTVFMCRFILTFI